MDKEEILKKSREENKNMDVYDLEVQRDGRNIGAVVAVILAFVFFVIQLCTGGGKNYALFAIAASVFSSTFIVKAVKRKRKHEIVVALFYTIATVLFSILHICKLVNPAFGF